jgi:hypothetical protein
MPEKEKGLTEEKLLLSCSYFNPAPVASAGPISGSVQKN